MDLPDFLAPDAHGDIRLAGHRIGLYHVVTFYNANPSAELLAEEFPTLPLPLIRKVLAFYHENRADVDAYVARYQADLDRQQAAAVRGPSAEGIKAHASS